MEVFSFLYPIVFLLDTKAILALFIGVLYGLIVGKHFSYRLAVYSGLFLGIFVSLLFVFIFNLKYASLCATFDTTPCTLTQSQILRNVFNIMLSLTPDTLINNIVPGTIGVIIGGYISRLIKKP